MKDIMKSASAALAVLVLLVSCATVPDPASIPPDLSVAELNLRAQNALDSNNLKAAEVYYQLILNRFGTDLSVLTAAEFEIAHLRVRQKRWDEAREMLEEIMSRYHDNEPNTLPAKYYVLARNDLRRIPADE